MAECVPVFNMANLACRTRVGRPKKYEGLWSTVNKRGYILGTTLEQLRRIKDDNDFPSDDEAVQYLLQRHERLLSIEQGGKR